MPRLPVDTVGSFFDNNIDEAKKFLSALDPGAKDFLFVAIHSDHHKAPRVTRREPTDEWLASMSHWNKEGWNMYVTVNETNHGSGTGRSKEEVTRFRAIFSDDDGKAPSLPYPIPPSAIIETSPGKKQVYWLLDTSAVVDVSEWDQLQQTLVNDYGGDAQARDAARILRIPGFHNTKPDYSPPPLCRIISLDSYIYTWDQIRAAFPLSEVVSPTGKAAGEALDVKATMEQFISGTNYHQAGIALAGYYYNIGIEDPNRLTEHLQSLIDIQGDISDPRFLHRRNQDIPNTVAWVIKQRLKENAGLVTLEIPEREEKNTKQSRFTELPIPGGGLNAAIDYVKSIMVYPNDAIAIIVAEHLISVFGGGHYHIKGNTTTRKRIMLAPMAAGKNTITKALGYVVAGLSSLTTEGMPYVIDAEKFIGSDSFSFSIQHKQIEEHRVRSFLVNEAGVSGKSRAGDIDNLRAYQLQALSTKANELFMPKKFSEQGNKDASQQMQNVTGGVWVYLHESTIKSYASLLQNTDAFTNGDLSRSDIFFIKPNITIKNKIHSSAIMPPDMLQMFSNLANDFLMLPGGKGTEDHGTWEAIDTTEIEDKLDELEDAIIVKRNDAYDADDEIAIAMLGRRYERIMTSILICALADAAFGKTRMGLPTAHQYHLDYAIKRADAIDGAMLYHAKGGGALSGSRFDQVVEQFKTRMREITKSKRKAQRYRMQSSNPGDGGGSAWVLTKSGFNQALRNGAAHDLRSMEGVYRGDHPRADRAIIEHLIGLELIIPVTYTTKAGDIKTKANRWWLDRGLFPV